MEKYREEDLESQKGEYEGLMDSPYYEQLIQQQLGEEQDEGNDTFIAPFIECRLSKSSSKTTEYVIENYLQLIITKYH